MVVVSLLLLLFQTFNLVNGQIKNSPMTLGTFSIDKKAITISGHSSGASFVHNLHLAHSKLFSGVGIFSGLYYQFNGLRFKPGQLKKDAGGVGVKNSIASLKEYSEVGLVDQLTCLRYARIFIYAGTADAGHGIGQRVFAIDRIYKPHVKAPDTQIKMVIKYAPHAAPTGVCTADDVMSGFDCSYNGISDMFHFLYKSRLRDPSGKVKLQKVRKFDQTEFFHDIGTGDDIAMNDFGLIYIPSGCSRPGDKCLLHLFFIGCQPNGTGTGSNFNYALRMPFYEIAETNNIILVTPIQKANKDNTGTCWDFLGFTGSRYATNEGLQIQVVSRLIGRILGEERTNDKKCNRKSRDRD